MNYLPDAAQHDADIFTQVEVQYISPSETSQGQWDVHCILVGATNPSNPPLSFVVSTKLLVLAAGTLGTTEILLRSRERNAFSMSAAVG
jgi:cholesterol oxidase|tara:strand:- start:323 stop:589 length:267 start_codon:yes stop_codon:yes gene_type:complete